MGDGAATAHAARGRGGSPALAVARAWWMLPHPTPIAVVLAATAGFAWLVRRGQPSPGELTALLVAMLGGQLAIGAVNEIVDADLDRVAKPGKPIPSGLVSVDGARGLAVAGLGLMMLCGIRFGPVAFGLLVLGTGLGLAYDLWFKRTPLSWLPYALALPLLPIWVRAALDRFDPVLLLLYPLGAAAAVGVHLAQALPDAAVDRAAGLANPVSWLGERRAFVAALGLAFTAPAAAVLSALVAPGWLASPWIVLLGALAATAALVAAAALYAADRPLGVRLCFPLVAAGTVAVGLAWVLGAAG